MKKLKDLEETIRFELDLVLHVRGWISNNNSMVLFYSSFSSTDCQL